MDEGRRRDTLRQRLTEYLLAVSGARDVEIERLTPLDGLGRENWLVEAELGDRKELLVFQRAWARRVSWTRLEVGDEYRLLEAMRAASVPAPEPRWYCEEAAILGGPFLVTTYAAAGGIPSPDALGEILARIHAIQPEAAGLASRSTADVAELPRRLRARLSRMGLHRPALEFVLRWIESRLPDDGPVALLHGDFRAAQVITDESGIRAVCGWERCHPGDVHAELAWAGLRGHWPGSAADYDRFLKVYARASGRTVDQAALRTWSLIGHVEQATRLLEMGTAFRDAGARSPAMLVMGRRAAQAELEALRLIAMQESTPDD